MSDRRIKPPKDKEALILKLAKGDEPSSEGIFQTRAHLLTFAAAYGFSKNRRLPFTESLDGIRSEVFDRNGYDTVINLLALATTTDPRCLAATDEAEEERIAIFEEFANGGLEELRTELQGVDDPLEHLLLVIQQQEEDEKEPVADFDLSRFLQ